VLVAVSALWRPIRVIERLTARQVYRASLLADILDDTS
jgi:hypothetical protein